MKVYKFGAEWCGPCRTLNRNLNYFKECEVVNFNVDETDEETLNKYNIRNIPVTILVDDNDNELYRWVGLFNVNEIAEKMKEYD